MFNKKVGFLLFDEFTAMDAIGPLEAFVTVEEVMDFRYQPVMIGVRAGQVLSESGMAVARRRCTRARRGTGYFDHSGRQGRQRS